MKVHKASKGGSLCGRTGQTAKDIRQVTCEACKRKFAAVLERLPDVFPAVKYLDQVYPHYEIVERPLWWHTAGLQQTKTGYGQKLTSSRCVRLPNGRERRIYITQYSNAGSAWVMHNGEQLFLRGADW